MYNFSDYEATHNKAIDFCANLIAAARKQNTPVKALHLKPSYYEWFKSGVQILMNKDLLPEEKMQFDSVDIELGTVFQTKMVVIEYYPMTIGQA